MSLICIKKQCYSIDNLIRRREYNVEHVSKLAEAIANTVSAAQAEDGAELAKSIVNIVANAGGIIQDIAHAFGY